MRECSCLIELGHSFSLVKEMNKRLLLAIFSLAGLAGLLRYWLNLLFVSAWTNLLLNMVAVFCLVLGLEGYLATKQFSPSVTKALQVGFFGGLTTMASPFLLIYQAFDKKDYWQVILIWSLHLLGGLLAAYLGRFVIRRKRWER